MSAQVFEPEFEAILPDDANGRGNSNETTYSNGTGYFSISDSFRDFGNFLNAHRAKVISLIVAYVAMLSVIGLQNVPYIDDSHRRLSGATDFGPWDGRWGSEFLANIIFQGPTVVDLGLTTFILSGVLLAFASLIVIYALVGNRANWWTFAFGLLIALNPWFLNAVAFRFDGPLISFGLLVAAGTFLFARCRPLIMFLGYLVLTWVIANFFQPLLGLTFILLMTYLLLDWLNGNNSLAYNLKRFAIVLTGVLLGAGLYLLQTMLIVPGRARAQVVTFDFGNLPGALRQNTVAFLRQFLSDSNSTWMIFQVLVGALFIAAVVYFSRRVWWQALIGVLVYGVLLVFAAGNVLLLATTTHVTSSARFMAPLAMALAIMAIVLSAVELPRVFVYLTRTVLVVFAYLWLSIVFVFAMVLHEQNASLRFQVSQVASTLFREYRTGDTIIYDPQIFHNPLYLTQVQRRFPIFANDFYSDVISPGDGSIRFRIAALLGLDMGHVMRTNEAMERDGNIITGDAVCLRRNVPDAAVATGARWEVFRADAGTVCVTFPSNFINAQGDASGGQSITFDLNAFPFGPGLGPHWETLSASDMQIAIWSIDDPSDVRWFYPSDIGHGVAQFFVPAPDDGWAGGLLAAHFFIDGQMIYQYIWPVVP